MDSVGGRGLRHDLSVHLRRVEAGEPLRATDHGPPVALLTPLPPDDDPIDDALADLVAAGRVSPPERPFRVPQPLTLPAGCHTLS